MDSSKMYPSLNDFIQKTIDLNQTDRPVYIANFDDVVEKVNQWNRMLPSIKPYYAVKVCATPGIVSLLGKLGTSFDCASETEINQVLSDGVSPSDIIFANPCKTDDMITYARNRNVKVMTFDTETEMVRISKLFPEAQLVIRLKVDDTCSKYKLNLKFGMKVDEVKPILMKAKELNMKVIGVAFHIGSDSKNPESFYSALQSSRDVFNIASELGFNEFNLLDIGGGFPGDIDFNDSKNLFYRMVEVINKSLDKLFPKKLFPDLRVIAEPGRYFVSSALSLVVKVISTKSTVDPESGERNMMYNLNDGLFGSFLIKFWEPELVSSLQPFLPEAELEKRKKYKSILFGPTCDSLDVVTEKDSFPELLPGDHLIVTNYGAYTVPLTTPFNGILPPFYQYYSTTEWTPDGLNEESVRKTIKSYVDLNRNLLQNGHFELPN